MTPKELGFFSLPANDLNEAKDFFMAVMGWNFQDRDSTFSYIFAGEEMIGSLEKSDAHHRPSMNGPLLYFRADKIESALELVRSEKGEVLFQEAINEGENGFRAFFTDPSGNRLAFWAQDK